MTALHPIEPIPAGIANDGKGARAPVPAVDAERLLCDEKEDRRRNTSERARSAESGHSWLCKTSRFRSWRKPKVPAQQRDARGLGGQPNYVSSTAPIGSTTAR